MNIHLIRKLTDKELLAYLRKDSIYSSEAIEVVLNILENERNYPFSNEQKENVLKVIKYKKELEFERSAYFDNDYEVDDVSENQNFPKLESKKNIIALSFLSIINSGYLIYTNLKSLKLNSKSNIHKLIFIVSFFVILEVSILLLYHFFGYDWVVEFQNTESSYIYRRKYLKPYYLYLTIYLFLNFIFSIILWDIFMKPGIKYRAKNQPNL